VHFGPLEESSKNQLKAISLLVKCFTTVSLSLLAHRGNADCSHSSELKIKERFHRVDMELTVTINDPKMYTELWLALNKFPLRLQPRGFDIR
jgi:hypothetical protein